jgi:hypothetical protein
MRDGIRCNKGLSSKARLSYEKEANQTYGKRTNITGQSLKASERLSPQKVRSFLESVYPKASHYKNSYHLMVDMATCV